MKKLALILALCLSFCLLTACGGGRTTAMSDSELDKKAETYQLNYSDEDIQAAIAVAQEMSLAYRESLVGTTHPVLFEEADGEFFVGHAPNYVKFYVRGENLHNEIRNVTVTEVFRDGVLGCENPL